MGAEFAAIEPILQPLPLTKFYLSAEGAVDELCVDLGGAIIRHLK